MHWLKIVIMIVAMTAGSNATAQTILHTCAPDYQGTRTIGLNHNDRLGVWVAEPVMQCMLRWLTAVPQLEQRVTLLQANLAMRSSQVETLRHAVDIAEDVETVLRDNLEYVTEARDKAEARAHVWWRHPILWFSVGAIMVGAVFALTAYGLSAAN